LPMVRTRGEPPVTATMTAIRSVESVSGKKNQGGWGSA
jgi:hypothetical protein